MEADTLISSIVEEPPQQVRESNYLLDAEIDKLGCQIHLPSIDKLALPHMRCHSVYLLGPRPISETENSGLVL